MVNGYFIPLFQTRFISIADNVYWRRRLVIMNNKNIIVISSLFISIVLAVTLAYTIMKGSTPPVVLCVEPQTIQGVIGQDFTININISNVIDLYGWSFKLSWNTTILEVVNVTEGTFLRNGDTFFVPKINNTAGYMLVDCTLLGNVSGVSGNGTLAIIEFHAKEGGACDLNLYETMLINSDEQSIIHTIVNGYFSSVS